MCFNQWDWKLIKNSELCYIMHASGFQLDFGYEGILIHTKSGLRAFNGLWKLSEVLDKRVKVHRFVRSNSNGGLLLWSKQHLIKWLISRSVVLDLTREMQDVRFFESGDNHHLRRQSSVPWVVHGVRALVNRDGFLNGKNLICSINGKLGLHWLVFGFNVVHAVVLFSDAGRNGTGLNPIFFSQIKLAESEGFSSDFGLMVGHLLHFLHGKFRVCVSLLHTVGARIVNNHSDLNSALLIHVQALPGHDLYLARLDIPTRANVLQFFYRSLLGVSTQITGCHSRVFNR